MVALVVIVCFIIVDTKSKNVLYEISSYILTYALQYLGLVLVLYREQGSNKEFILCAIYMSLPTILCALGTGLFIVYFKTDPTTALTLVGPGLLLTDWISKKMQNQ